MNTAADYLNKISNDHLAHAINEAYLMGSFAIKRLSGMTVSESELYESAYRVTQQAIMDVPVFIIRRNAELLRAAYIAGYNDNVTLPIRRNTEPKFKVGDSVSATTYDGETINGTVKSTHSNPREVYYIVMTENGTVGVYEEFTQPRNVPSVTIYPVIGLYGDVRNDERINVKQVTTDNQVTVFVAWQYQFSNEWHNHRDALQYGVFDAGSDEVTYFIVDSIESLYREHLGCSLPARYFQQNPGRPE